MTDLAILVGVWPAQIVPEFVTKIIQVFDCKVARHGNMLVGRTGSGKSEAWKCLQRALGRLRKEEPDDDRYQKVGLRAAGYRPLYIQWPACLSGRALLGL